MKKDIWVSGNRWKYETSKRVVHEGKEVDGLTIYRNKNIIVGNNPDVITVVHELLHAIMYEQLDALQKIKMFTPEERELFVVLVSREIVGGLRQLGYIKE